MTAHRTILLPLALGCVCCMHLASRSCFGEKRSAAEVPPEVLRSATDAAVNGLKDQVDRLPLGPSLTVGRYLNAVQGHEVMLKRLAAAKRIGGPRILSQPSGAFGDRHDPDDMAGVIIQVRLDITGAEVAAALVEIAGSSLTPGPISVEAVRRDSLAWSGRDFTSTGSNAGGSNFGGPADAARPNEATTQEPATGITTTRSAVSDSVAAPPAGDSARAAGDSARAAGDSAHPGSNEGEHRGGGPVSSPAVQTGRPEVSMHVEVSGAERRLVIPTDRRPGWFSDPLTTAGLAKSTGSRLGTARAAEAAATEILRLQLEELKVAEDLTLGQLVARDARFAQVINRAIQRAYTERIFYSDDGAATARVSTDPRYLWQDIVAAAEAGR